MSYSPGEQILLTFDRKVPRRRELVLPVTIIDDSPQQTIVSITAGTPTKALMLADGSTPPRNLPYRELAKMDRVLGDSIWTGTNVLFCWRPDWLWDVRLMWDAFSGEFLNWYVNIQDPMRQTDTGFATTDHFLDVVVLPDFSWTLKDEAEFEDAVMLGMYTNSEIATIRESVASAINLVESRGWPFDSRLICAPPGMESTVSYS